MYLLHCADSVWRYEHAAQTCSSGRRCCTTGFQKVLTAQG